MPPVWVQGLLFTVCVLSLLHCPHSKVEESFNLQATHDLFYYGITPALRNVRMLSSESTVVTTVPLYDHWNYPGVVPRTFAGPILLSITCQLIRWIGWIGTMGYYDLANHAIMVQRLVRLILLTLTWWHWVQLAQTMEVVKGAGDRIAYKAGRYYLLLVTACQFHMTYYSSRLLPNSLATILTLRCFTHWIRGGNWEMMGAAIDLVLAATVFRCDLILLLFTVGLSWLFTRQLSFGRAIQIGIGTVCAALVMTTPIDSLLWRRPVWPEGEVLYFNTVLNKSTEWGIMTWHWYFSKALPLAMLFTILLVPLSVLRLPEVVSVLEHRFRRNTNSVPFPNLIDTTWIPFVFPAVGFVALYSLLGHKETRFLFPALPLFNIAAAIGMSRIHIAAFPPNSKDKFVSILARLGFGAGVLLLLVSFLAAIFYVHVSRHNYPGGDALDILVNRVANQVDVQSTVNEISQQVRVYVDVAAAMTGVSLFGQRAAQQRTPGLKWTFDKAGYEPGNKINTSDWSIYTHLLTEDRDPPAGFLLVGQAKGNPRVSLVKMELADSMFVYEKDQWWNATTWN